MEHANRLEAAVVAQYWESVSVALANLLRLMDSREDWVPEDDNEYLREIERLADLIGDSQFAGQLAKPENSAVIAELLCTLDSSRSMRLLQMIDRRQPGFVTRMALAFKQIGGIGEVHANLFYERLSIINRTQLTQTIFSKERAERIAEDLPLLMEDM